MILLARLVILAGPQWEMSLWNLAPHNLTHWMKTDTAAIFQAQSSGQNLAWMRTMPGSIPPEAGKRAPSREGARSKAPSKNAVSESDSGWGTLLSLLPAAWLAGALAVISGIAFSNLRRRNPLVARRLAKRCPQDPAVGLPVKEPLRVLFDVGPSPAV